MGFALPVSHVEAAKFNFGKPIGNKMKLPLAIAICVFFGTLCSVDRITALGPSTGLAVASSLANTGWGLTAQLEDEKGNRVWRRTKTGWQVVELPADPFVHLIRIPHRAPLIHPIRMATLVLLGVLALAAWASSEWDWSRLVSERAEQTDGEP